MKYKIITNGTFKEVTLGEISRNLKTQSEFYAIQDGEVYLGVISHKALVFLATEFADYAIKNYAKKYLPKAEACLSLTRRWIEDDSSVSEEELRAAADAAYAAYAAYAANSAYAAAYAANAAAVRAAYAAYAADAAAYAAYAANAAYAAAGKDRDGEFERQGRFILDYLSSNAWLFNL
jgi:hypothetical protein